MRWKLHGAKGLEILWLWKAEGWSQGPCRTSYVSCSLGDLLPGTYAYPGRCVVEGQKLAQGKSWKTHRTPPPPPILYPRWLQLPFAPGVAGDSVARLWDLSTTPTPTPTPSHGKAREMNAAVGLRGAVISGFRAAQPLCPR